MRCSGFSAFTKKSVSNTAVVAEMALREKREERKGKLVYGDSMALREKDLEGCAPVSAVVSGQ